MSSLVAARNKISLPAKPPHLRLSLLPVASRMPSSSFHPRNGSPGHSLPHLVPHNTPISPSDENACFTTSTSTTTADDLFDVSEIIPGRLYISDLSFAENPSHLSKYGITHILSALQDVVSIPPIRTSVPSHPLSTMPTQTIHPPATATTATSAPLAAHNNNNTIIHKQVYIADFPFAELGAYLPETTAFIESALLTSSSHRVLVHCHQGISRSASVVTAYLMHAYAMSANDALAYVKTKRRIADPNIGFIHQLHEYARDHLGQKMKNR